MILAALAALTLALARTGWSDATLAPPALPDCPAYTSEQDEPLLFEAVGDELPEGAARLDWVRPTAAIYTAPFSAEPPPHTGTDYVHDDPAVPDVAVVAAAGGRVAYVREGCPQSNTFNPNQLRRGCGGGLGVQIVLDHGGGIYTRYAHLEPDSVGVAVGQQVAAGERLARMGNSGSSTLRHLHFELGSASAAPDPCGPVSPFERTYDPSPLGF